MPELGASVAALEMAIQTELDGFAFYQQFAERAEDANARVMFQRLAEDEVAHLELLRNAKAKLEQDGRWSHYAGSAPESAKGAPIFSRERVAQNVVAYTSDLSALRVAYLIEKDAVDFYARAAEETSDPDGKRMFLDLVRMEQGHLDLLEGEYRFLRSQFQNAMGFAPF
jgi:rubrerythrin